MVGFCHGGNMPASHDNDDVDDVDLHSNTKETRQMENIEELLDFFLVANDETRRNVTGLMKVLTLSIQNRIWTVIPSKKHDIYIWPFVTKT